jgi:hypothetical protein
LTGVSPLRDLPQVNRLFRESLGWVSSGQFLAGLKLCC